MDRPVLEGEGMVARTVHELPNSLPALLLILLLGGGSALAEPPSSFAGIGLRGGAGDSTSLALGVTLEMAEFRLSKKVESSLSLRPNLLIGSYLEARVPLSLEFGVSSILVPFIFTGAAFNTDEFGHVDHMLGFGTDVWLSKKIGLSLTYNTIYQSRIPDHDTELMILLNFGF